MTQGNIDAARVEPIKRQNRRPGKSRRTGRRGRKQSPKSKRRERKRR
jgi:hypothetical protein